MKVLNFSFFSDLIFSAIASFLLCLVTVSYFTAYPFNLIVSICFALIFTLISFKVFYSRRSKKVNALKQKEKEQATLNGLCFFTKPKLLSLFEKAFTVKGERVEKKTTYLYLPDKNELLFFIFCFDGVVKADIVKAFNKLKQGETARIFAPDYLDEIEKFASRFNGRIILEKGSSIFTLLEETNLLPEIEYPLPEKKKEKLSFKKFFAKTNFLRYFLFGCLFLLMSFIVPFKIYYVISGSALLIFALVSKFVVKDTV